MQRLMLAVSLTLLLSGSAVAHGPTPGLAGCHMSTTRGTISPHFGIQACLDGAAVVLRNDLSFPVRVVLSGSVGGRSYVWRDPSPAAEVTRVRSHDSQLLMPGEVLRIPVGGGSAQIQLQGASAADKTYAIASVIASAIPGKAASRVNAIARLTSDAGDAHAKYQNCTANNSSIRHRAACFTVLTRDVYFAIGRAGLAAFSKLLAPVLWGIDFSKSVDRQVHDLASWLLHSLRVFHISAKPQPPPTPSPSPVPSPGGPTPAPPSGQRTIRLDWNTNQTDIDLHIWDPSGNEAWYSNYSGIPNGQLSQDITDGYGPETFTTTDTSTPLAVGVCYYASHTDDGSIPPTNVTVTITEANGSQHIDTIALSQPSDEQVVDSSPQGSATFVPAAGWCYNDNGAASG
jgi:hypothetical protein